MCKNKKMNAVRLLNKSGSLVVVGYGECMSYFEVVWIKFLPVVTHASGHLYIL